MIYYLIVGDILAPEQKAPMQKKTLKYEKNPQQTIETKTHLPQT